MIEVYMDGPTIEQMASCDHKDISGFTTNPSLMRGLGVTNYEAYCREALDVAAGLPVSLEVFADEPAEMQRQGLIIAGWGPNAVVKIPITNTRGESTASIVRNLAREGVSVNVTAVFTSEQVGRLFDVVGRDVKTMIVSVFAGRIADTGRDPEPIMRACLRQMGPHHLLWASTREVFNHEQADRCGADIITMSYEQIVKMKAHYMRELKQFSMDTVQMFYRDAQLAGYVL